MGPKAVLYLIFKMELSAYVSRKRNLAVSIGYCRLPVYGHFPYSRVSTPLLTNEPKLNPNLLEDSECNQSASSRIYNFDFRQCYLTLFHTTD